MAPDKVESGKRMPEKRLKYKKETMKKQRLGLVPYFNNDIMWDIFKRVPAISLLDNCSLVSKRCLNLIQNQTFLKAHFLGSKHGILLVEKLEMEGKTIQVMKFVEFKESQTEIGKVHHLHTFKERVAILTACPGLCTLFDLSSSNSSLMNPLTKESIQLPPLVGGDLWRKIAFDRANTTYMVVDFSRGELRCLFTLTLRGLDGSCKRIQGLKSWLGTPVLINGVLYFNGRDKGLWCFDLSIETFCLLRWPIDVDSNFRFHISDAGGFVCCVVIDAEINIWILKQQTWVHKCCIHKEQPLAGEPWRRPKFVGCLGSDELFVFTKDWDRLDAYNVKAKQWMMIKPADSNESCGIYVSSLLPLKSKMVS